MIWCKVRQFRGLRDRTYIPAAVTVCFFAHSTCLPTSTALQVPAVGTPDLSFWSVVLDLSCFQVAWPLSETDINWKDQSGLAFEELFQILLCKPAGRCGVPFMFPLHPSLQRAKGGSSSTRSRRGRSKGLWMLVANSFQVN